MLSIEQVSFGYEQPVLRRVSFEVHAGELLTLLGPNGAGKSTLLRLLTGESRPHTGQIRLDSRPLAAYSRREIAQLVGYVPQETLIRFPLTVLEFVLQGRFAHMHGLGFESAHDLAAAERAMQLTDTASLARRRINEISGGERQRVLLARALAQEPRLLILDELTANLDINYQVSMLELIKHLTQTQQLAAVVVTHELNLAAEFADRILLLRQGELVGYGTPGEVLTETRLQSLFPLKLLIDRNPLSGAPRITFAAQWRTDEIKDR